MQAVANIDDIFVEGKEGEDGMCEEQKRDLFAANEGQTYIIKDIRTDDDEMNAFLFRLGCYSGEPITVITKKKKSCIVAIKDSRYTLDKQLCEAIRI